MTAGARKRTVIEKLHCEVLTCLKFKQGVVMACVDGYSGLPPAHCRGRRRATVLAVVDVREQDVYCSVRFASRVTSPILGRRNA